MNGDHDPPSSWAWLVCALLCAGCTFINATDVVCDDPPGNATLTPGPGPMTWLSGNTPVATTPTTQTQTSLAFLFSDAGPYDMPEAQLGIASFGDETHAVTNCQVDQSGGAVDSAQAIDGGQSATSPSLAFASDEGSGAIAYRLATLPGNTAPERLRVSLLDDVGCPTSDENGAVFVDADDTTLARTFADPSVAYLRGGTYAVAWLSSSADLTVFDDHVRARLLRSSGQKFPANFGSLNGDAIDLELDDHWIIAPVMLRVQVPGSAAPSLCLVWYARSGRQGSIKLALFDERLQRTTSVVELDEDQDEGSDVANKVISAIFSDARSALYITWTRSSGPAGGTTLRGRRVDLRPEISPGVWFELDAGSDIGGASWTALGDDLVAAWRSSASIEMALLDSSTNPRFTRYGCGAKPFAIVASRGFEASHPVLTTRAGRVELLFDRARATEQVQDTWSVGYAAFGRGEIVP